MKDSMRVSMRDYILIATMTVAIFGLGRWTAPPRGFTVTDAANVAWEFIEEKAAKKEIYFTATVESLVKQSMSKDVKTGFEYGRAACGRTEPLTIIVHRQLPHGVVVTDTVTFIFD